MTETTRELADSILNLVSDGKTLSLGLQRCGGPISELTEALGKLKQLTQLSIVCSNELDVRKEVGQLRLHDGPPEDSVLHQLVDLDWIGELTNLEQIDLRGCSALRCLRGLASLPKLERMIIGDCPAMRCSSALAGLQSIRRIDAVSLKTRDLACLQGIPSLKTLNLDQCVLLRSLQPSVVLEGVTHLSISDCRELVDFDSLESCSNLVEFSCHPMKTENLRAISGHSDLRRLSILGWVDDISDITHLKKLTSISLATTSLCSIAPIAGCRELTELELDCESLCGLEAVAGLPKLRKLVVRSASRIADLTPLAGLQSLEEISIKGGISICTLEPLSDLRGLEVLKLEDFPNVSRLEPITSLGSLRELKLYKFPPLRQSHILSYISGQLKEINVGELVDLKWVESQPFLEQIVLYSSPKLADLTPLTSLSGLSTLYLWGSHNISDFSALKSIKSLEAYSCRVRNGTDMSIFWEMPLRNAYGDEPPVHELPDEEFENLRLKDIPSSRTDQRKSDQLPPGSLISRNDAISNNSFSEVQSSSLSMDVGNHAKLRRAGLVGVIRSMLSKSDVNGRHAIEQLVVYCDRNPACGTPGLHKQMSFNGRTLLGLAEYKCHSCLWVKRFAACLWGGFREVR